MTVAVTKKGHLELHSNPAPKRVKASIHYLAFENAKAVLEIARILHGKPYTTEQVWELISDEVLHKEAR